MIMKITTKLTIATTNAPCPCILLRSHSPLYLHTSDFKYAKALLLLGVGSGRCLAITQLPQSHHKSHSLSTISKHMLRHSFVVVEVHALQHGSVGEFYSYFAVQHVFAPKSFDSGTIIVDKLPKTLQHFTLPRNVIIQTEFLFRRTPASCQLCIRPSSTHRCYNDTRLFAQKLQQNKASVQYGTSSPLPCALKVTTCPVHTPSLSSDSFFLGSSAAEAGRERGRRWGLALV